MSGRMVAYLPDESIIFIGDMLFNERHPYMGGGDPESWKNTLKKIMINWIYNEHKHCGVDYSDEKLADQYDEQHQKFRDYEKEFNNLIDFLSLKDTHELTVIELGCGTGATSIYAAKRFKNVYGVDISEDYTCIYADSKGRIWIGAYYNKIVLFSVEDDKIDHYYEEKKVENVIYSITEDNTGNIWFTTGLNLVKFDGINFIPYYDENIFWIWRNNIIADHNDDIWVTTWTKLNRLHDEKWETEYVFTECDPLKDSCINELVMYSIIMEDSKNNIWVCTDKGVMMKANN